MSHYDSQPETEENSASFYHNRTQLFPGQEDTKKKKKKTMKKKIEKVEKVGDNINNKQVPQDITPTSSNLQKTVLKNKKKEIKKEQEDSNQDTKQQRKEQKKKEMTKIRRFQTQSQILEKSYKKIQQEQTQPVLVKRKVSSSPKKQRSGKKESKVQQDYRVCEHVSIFNKLLISFVLTAVYIVFLRPLPKISYPLAQYGQQIHQRVFQIVTDRKTVTLRFPIQITQPIFQILPITSTKSARIKASLNCSLGYKFESISTTPSTQHIQMSNLQILSCSINEVQLFNKEDGIFNPWEFRDHQKLLSYINQHYVSDLKKQALNSISQEKREMYATRAQILFRGIHEKYQGWLDWLIGRISTYVDFGLEPYVKKVQLMYAQDRVRKQEVYIQGDQTK